MKRSKISILDTKDDTSTSHDDVQGARDKSQSNSAMVLQELFGVFPGLSGVCLRPILLFLGVSTGHRCALKEGQKSKPYVEKFF